MKRTPLRRVSKKREALNRKRRAFVDEQLSKRTECEAGMLIGKLLGYSMRWPGCGFYSTTMHEPLTRARAPGAETILDEDNSVAICDGVNGGCHRWVHDNPAQAEKIGLLRSSRGLTAGA